MSQFRFKLIIPFYLEFIILSLAGIQTQDLLGTMLTLVP